jgi:hypothetical protein
MIENDRKFIFRTKVFDKIEMLVKKNEFEIKSNLNKNPKTIHYYEYPDNVSFTISLKDSVYLKRNYLDVNHFFEDGLSKKISSLKNGELLFHLKTSYPKGGYYVHFLSRVNNLNYLKNEIGMKMVNEKKINDWVYIIAWYHKG